MMFKSILVTTDLSESSLSAIPVAKQLGSALGSHIHLLHVLETHEFFMPTPDGYIPADLIQKSEEHAYESAVQELSKIRDNDLSGHPVDCHVIKTEGQSVYDKINTFTKENKIELVVIGTHGRTGIQRIVMGSVAERVSREASCPVMLVPPTAE